MLPTVAAGAALVPVRPRLGLSVLGLAGAITLFFRDPDRPLVPEPGTVYAAADGFIAGVEEPVEEPWMPEGKALRISTFLSLHNVHVNRSPVGGVVVEREEIRGGFAPALFGSAEDNTRNRLALDTDHGRVVVVQIAGLIARTIRCWVGIGDQVRPGQHLGLIHFGSRTDVLLPVGSAEVLVRPGDRVRAGVTALAHYREDGDAHARVRHAAQSDH